MGTTVSCRLERPGDEAAVRAVVAAAFGDTEGGRHSVSAIVDDLRSSDAWLGLSYLAETGGQVVGHVSFTRSLLDAPRRLVDVLVLSPLSVAPHMQRRGIGSELVRHALAALAGRPEPMVFLEGDPAYYSRLGFRPGGPLGLRRPSLRVPEAAFQVWLLPGYEEWMTGTLVYHRVWWDHDAVGLRE